MPTRPTRRVPRPPRPLGIAGLACLGLAVAAWASAGPAGVTQERADARAQADASGSGRPLFIDDAHRPTLGIAWTTRTGERVSFSATLPWGTKNDLAWLGYNVEGFVAVGGTRIDLQQGHPLGSVVRVGFYKTDTDEPFFFDIKPGSVVEVRLSGVRFLEPAVPTVATAMQHLQYTLEDVRNCGLDGSARDQYNTADASDTLGGQVTSDNGRPGSLRVLAAGSAGVGQGEATYRDGPPRERRGTVSFSTDADGAITMQARIPYELFRHVRDPWLRVQPGTFFEPQHFHVEFESLPARLLADQP